MSGHAIVAVARLLVVSAVAVSMDLLRVTAVMINPVFEQIERGFGAFSYLIIQNCSQTSTSAVLPYSSCW
jgi:hypothetical protein